VNPLPTAVENKQGQTFTVRWVGVGDLEALVSFYDDFEPKRGAQGLPPIGRFRIERWLAGILATGAHLLVERGGRVVGHALLMPMGEARGEYAIFLHQHERGAGLGTAVNRLAVEAALSLGYRRLWLSVEPSNRAALISYERVGFRFLPGALYSVEAEMGLELD
jgi:diamine N-acetyltransferase